MKKLSEKAKIRHIKKLKGDRDYRKRKQERKLKGIQLFQHRGKGE